MRATAIVCEYNPIHKGHGYLIDAAKAKNDCVICIMSGNTVQRGEFAIVDKYLRAEAALSAGADLVLELPFPYSVASSEYFCTAGVYIANCVGAESLTFGSECGDLAKLEKYAERLDACREKLFTDTRIGTAKEWIDTVGQGESINSNDILGIGYVSAVKKIAPRLRIEAVKRIVADYNSLDSETAAYSASAIRKMITDGESLNRDLFPNGVYDIFENAKNCGFFPVDMKNIGNTLLAMLRFADISRISECAECSGGVGERLVSVACESESFDGFLQGIATKRYTNAKLRRATIYALTGVTAQDLGVLPPYTTLLAADDVGCRYLSETRYTRKIQIVTKPADIPSDEKSRRIAELSQKIDSLYTLSMPKPQNSGYFSRKSPKIISKSVD